MEARALRPRLGKLGSRPPVPVLGMLGSWELSLGLHESLSAGVMIEIGFGGPETFPAETITAMPRRAARFTARVVTAVTPSSESAA